VGSHTLCPFYLHGKLPGYLLEEAWGILVAVLALWGK
jgi:hypothetical protein